MPGGRPRKKIDYETVEKLAHIFCTQEEIATFLDLSLSKLKHDAKFLHVYKKGREGAKMSLRRIQFKLAEKNAGMAIFLGKNYLDQKDNRDLERDVGNIDEKLDKIARNLEKSDTDSS